MMRRNGYMIERRGGSGGREAGMVMLFMKRTKNEYLPDYIEYKKIIFM